MTKTPSKMTPAEHEAYITKRRLRYKSISELSPERQAHIRELRRKITAERRPSKRATRVQWQAGNSDKLRVYKHRHHELYPELVWFQQKVRNAERMGLPWHLTYECAVFLRWQPCWVCEKEGPSTLDRHDNSVREYVDWNTRPLCRPCNNSKNDIPIEDVPAWAAKRRRALGLDN